MLEVPELYRQLQQKQPDMVAELERYVAIESGSHDAAGIDEAGAAVAAAFAALGFDIERVPRPEAGDHLTPCAGFSRGGRRVGAAGGRGGD